LDDAVVDHGDAIVGVRVRVLVAGTSVGGPARVADAGGAGERLLGEELFEVGQLSLGALDLEPVGAEHGHARRVVSSVLELSQPLDDKPDALLGTDITYDSAHGFAPDRRAPAHG